ncbi:MAG: hypothetical protein QM809_10365 [Gordonia sp. (in: high G+C Gram-positive bacteria)]|uniref:hypothetical protein n=1 Tax=Gordonia sp. (in: high G+C Gram-positive bacteria) TaxID=84139 RepID=UPI0039E572F4
MFAFVFFGVFALVRRSDRSRRSRLVEEQRRSDALRRTGLRVQAVVTDYAESRPAGGYGLVGVLTAEHDDPSTRTVDRYEHRFAVVPTTPPEIGAPITVFVDPDDAAHYVFDLLSA